RDSTSLSPARRCVTSTLRRSVEKRSKMKIVVGVDGSEGSARALGWCAAHDNRLGAEVIAVHALELPAFAASLDPLAPPPVWRPDDRARIEVVLSNEWCKQLTDAA